MSADFRLDGLVLRAVGSVLSSVGDLVLDSTCVDLSGGLTGSGLSSAKDKVSGFPGGPRRVVTLLVHCFCWSLGSLLILCIRFCWSLGSVCVAFVRA